MRSRLLLPFLILLTLAAPLFAREPRQQQRIDFLLHAIGSMQGGVFIRNGSEYDAQAAEKHLRQKLNYGGEKLKTAELFIEYCATRSSVTGKPYKIRLPDGQTVESGPWLQGKLAEFDQGR